MNKVPVSGNVGKAPVRGEVEKRIPAPKKPAQAQTVRKKQKRSDTPMPKAVDPPAVIDSDSDTEELGANFGMLYYLDHS